MLKAMLGGALCLAGFVSASAAQAVLIDFDNYSHGTKIDGSLSFGDVTFASSGGTLLIDNFGAGKAICAFDSGACTGTLSLAFANGATDLNFDFSGDDVAGSQIGYGGESRKVSFRGRYQADGNPNTLDHVTIPIPDTIKLDLFSNDPGGVAFGNFQYAGAVPEPASWLMMIGGFALIGSAMRGRRSAAARATFS